jgi:hypothetical protein
VSSVEAWTVVAAAAVKALWSVAVHTLETVAAKDWLLSVWFKWDFTVAATLCTGCRVHGWTVETAFAWTALKGIAATVGFTAAVG